MQTVANASRLVVMFTTTGNIAEILRVAFARPHDRGADQFLGTCSDSSKLPVEAVKATGLQPDQFLQLRTDRQIEAMRTRDELRHVPAERVQRTPFLRRL